MQRYEIDRNDDRIYPMGLTVVDGGIHISVVAAGESCSLVLFHTGEEKPKLRIPFPPEQRMGDVWSMTIRDIETEGLEYGLEIDGSYFPDPYGKQFTGRESWGKADQVKRALKTPVCQETFDWEGDIPLYLPYEECVVYKAHIRGLTKHPSSKAENRGTFQAVTEKIPYLKELGITTLELMPVAEFQEVMMPERVDGNPYGSDEPTGKINYWGYTSSYCFAPKASYSSGKHKTPVHEFKTLVKTLHKNGIEVVIELFFSGNENPVFVLDAVRFWVREYHVDGVHLVGNAPTGLIGRDAYLSRTKLWADSWEGIDGGVCRHLGEYNDGFLIDMRRLLKGDEDQMNHLIYRSKRNPSGHGVINYIANTNGFTLMDMVSYDVKHNEANGENNQDGNDYNYSWNCGVEGPVRKKKLIELRKKQIRNAILMVFLSQGTPLLLSGDEFGNTKGGNNNSYCQDNEVSWLNWNQLKTNHDMFEFVKFVISFRKKHPVFHRDTEPKVMDYLACGHPDISYHGVKTWCPEFENFRRQLGIMYCGEYGHKPDGSVDDYFFVVYNMHWEPHEFALPNIPKERRWHVALNTNDQLHNGIWPEGQELLLENQKCFMVPSRTIIVFIGKQVAKYVHI